MRGYRLFRRAGGGPVIDIRALWEHDRRRCRICRKPVSLRWAVLDHIIPRAGPGDIDSSASNLQVAHRTCNILRGNGRLPAQVRLPVKVQGVKRNRSPLQRNGPLGRAVVMIPKPTLMELDKAGRRKGLSRSAMLRALVIKFLRERSEQDEQE